MKKINRKLLLSLLAIVFAFVALGTSTFAWFTLGTEVAVEGVEFTIDQQSGIEISQDKQSWKNSLTLTDMSAFEKLQPVTYSTKTIENVDTLGFRKINGAELNATDKAEFTVWLRMPAASKTNGDFSHIALTVLSAANGSVDTSEYKSEFTIASSGGDSKGLTKDIPYIFDALNALKVSFKKSDNTEKIFAIENDYSFGTVPTPNEGVIDSGLALNFANAKGFTIEDTDKQVVSFPTYATMDSIADNNLNANHQVLTVNTDFLAPADIDVAEAMATQDANYVYAKLTVTFWLEGWDPDCINPIIADSSAFRFVLKAYKQA